MDVSDQAIFIGGLRERIYTFMESLTVITLKSERFARDILVLTDASLSIQLLAWFNWTWVVQSTASWLFDHIVRQYHKPNLQYQWLALSKLNG